MRTDRNSVWRHYKREICRLCASRKLSPVVRLAPTPPANALVAPDEIGVESERFPLTVYRCDECKHLQLLDIINPNLLFSQYLYVSSTSPIMVDHLRRQAESTIERLGLGQSDLVLEIGSNDGTLLSFFQDAGLRVLGIDPAHNLAEIANNRGIPTWPCFFDSNVAEKILDEFGKTRLICANHCMAHIDNLSEVVQAACMLLDASGELVFEVGYLLDVYEKTLFDTIYHEHLDYHHVAPLVSFLEQHGMTLKHVERHDIQGGAIRGYAGPGQHAQEPSVSNLIALENAAGLNKKETFIVFERRIDQRAIELKSLLAGLKQEGRTIAAYGAPAKATTLMHQFGIDRSLVDYVVDDNPLKQGRLTPGFHVPVRPVETIYEDKPDYLLVLAWNFADSIVDKHERYTLQGGRFIIPLPDLSIRG